MTREENQFRSRLTAMARTDLVRLARVKGWHVHELNTRREIADYLWRKYQRDTLQRK